MLSLFEKEVKIHQSVINQIQETIGLRGYETGGILGKKGSVIDTFVYDEGLSDIQRIYLPDNEKLCYHINKWQNESIRFMGFIHSHNKCRILSKSDINYAHILLSQSSIKTMYMFLYLRDSKEIVSYYCCLK